ncbi:MAG: hypothetical protein AAGG48_01750 [Planctomycetota bacterium]
MTTSSENRTPAPEPNEDHWSELIATLPDETTQVFGDWLGDRLEEMVTELDAFVTPDSLRKSLRR